MPVEGSKLKERMTRAVPSTAGSPTPRAAAAAANKLVERMTKSDTAFVMRNGARFPESSDGDGASSGDDEETGDTGRLVATASRKLSNVEWRQRCRTTFKSVTALGCVGVVGFYLLSPQ
jgi:hypothetical protein